MGSMGKSDNRAEDMQPPATVETDSMVEGLCLSSFAAVSKPVPGKSATAGWVSCWRPFTPILFTSGIATGNAQGALRRRLWLRLAHPRLSWRISTGRTDSQPCRCSCVWQVSRPKRNDGLQDLLRPDSAALGLIRTTTLTRQELLRLRLASPTAPLPHTCFGRLRVGGAQDACGHRRPLYCTGSQPAAGFGRLRGGGAQDACGHRRPLYCTGRHPAAGVGRLRGGGAQDARGRGRPLYCTGRQPTAGFGRLQGGGAQDACWRGRPLSCTGRQPAAGSG